MERVTLGMGGNSTYEGQQEAQDTRVEGCEGHD